MANISIPVIAGVIIEQNNKILLIQEGKQKVYGLWNFPAGHVDKGESIEEAAIREAKEETGYNVELVQKINVFQLDHKAIIHTFEAKIIGGNLNFSSDEILNVKWFSFEEIKKMKDQLRESCWMLENIKIFQKIKS